MGIFNKKKDKIVKPMPDSPGPIQRNNFFSENKPTEKTPAIIVKPKKVKETAKEQPQEKILTFFLYLPGKAQQNRANLVAISESMLEDGIKRELLYSKINTVLSKAKEQHKNHSLTVFEIELPESKLNSKDEYVRFSLKDHIKSTIDVQTRDGKTISSQEFKSSDAAQKILSLRASSLPGQPDEQTAVEMDDMNMDFTAENMPSPRAPRK